MYEKCPDHQDVTVTHFCKSQVKLQ